MFILKETFYTRPNAGTTQAFFESIWRRGKNVTVCLWATSSSQIMGLSPQAFSPRENL